MTWTCQRSQGGEKCRHQNENKYQICRACNKRRPPRKSTAQLRKTEAGKLPYEEAIRLNGGEHCGVCGRGRPASGNKLHRDHDHGSGEFRGLLCFPCNRQLRPWVTIEWMERAVAYLQRAQTRSAAKAIDAMEESNL